MGRAKEELSVKRKQEQSWGGDRILELRNRKEAPRAGIHSVKGYEIGKRLETGQVPKCLVGTSQGLGLCSKSSGDLLMNLNKGVPPT